MRVDRGEFCIEVAGKPRHIRGFTGFLANSYYFSNGNAMRVLRRFPVHKAIDIGAAIGGWTLAALKAWGLDIEVHAFEPNPDTLKDLRHNLSGLSSVRIWPCAAMNVTGTFPLCKPAGERNVGQFSLVQRGEDRHMVEAVKLDDVLPDFCPDFIKIDVEGAEPNVLLGAEKMLRRSKPVLYVETTRTFIPVRQIVKDLGYTRMVRATGMDHIFVHPESPGAKAILWLDAADAAFVEEKK